MKAKKKILTLLIPFRFLAAALSTASLLRKNSSAEGHGTERRRPLRNQEEPADTLPLLQDARTVGGLRDELSEVAEETGAAQPLVET